ncbi:MAG TPA: alkaline phosphatase D family protein [Caulobacter sp.]|nr:alkaline phosphatase D family protein [Caulobacter sp.]
MTDLLRHRFALSRRRLFQFAGAAGAAGFALTLDERPALAQPVFADYPFQLGVAAGDPAPDGFVIWTRLAPRPLETGQGMPAQAVEVEWEVAADTGFKTPVKGVALARPELGHSVHVEVAGLEPGQPYFYRFRCGRETSPIGRAKTLPAAGAPVARARFGVAGCQHYEQGSYIAHRKLSGEDLDFVFFYGDYIYEGRSQRTRNAAGGPFENPRQHIGGEVYSLDDYRRRYAQYRMDADLQAAHASAAWFVVWDDHEIDNNWAGDIDADATPPAVFALRRQAAAQAFYEYMPLRLAALPVGPSIQLYRRAGFGDLMSLQFLDTRQYRSDQPCGDRWGVCGELDRQNAEMLGLRQEKWLYEGLSASKAKWNVLAQQVMVMDLDRDAGPDYTTNIDSWGGYRTPRARLLKAIRDRRVANPIVLTGDEHQNYAGEVFLDSRNPDGAPLAAEFVTTSISSSGDGMDQRPDMVRILAANPSLKFNNSQRGYSVCEVTPERWTTEYRVMDRVSDRGGTLSTRAKVSVEAGSSRVEVG